MVSLAIAIEGPERDRAEQLNALRILYDTSRELVLALDVETALLRVLDATVALLHADKGFVELLDDSDGRLRVIGHLGYAQTMTPRVRELRAGGRFEGAARHGRAVVVDAATDPALAPARAIVSEAGVRGLQSTPLYGSDGGLIGVVSTQYAEARSPRQVDLEFLDSLLAHAVHFIERLRVEEQLREKQRCADALLARLSPAGAVAESEFIRRVLVVDDNEDAANMLAELLEDAGHEVRTAYTGTDAMRVANTFLPDVVLLDIGLPDMDGYEVARRLRTGRAAGATIAALTGWTQPQNADRSEAAGIDVHLVKPASLQAIEDVIGSVGSRDVPSATPPLGVPSSTPDRVGSSEQLTRRVLVVDDDDDIRESLIDFLEEHGFQPVGARDGVDALAKLASLDPPPCLIILDLMMPNMDGRTFREKQMERAGLADIPVVVISAYRDVEQNARDLQVRNWLAKPLNLPVLLQVVENACTA